MKALLLMPPPYHDGAGNPSLDEFRHITRMHEPVCAIYSGSIHMEFAKIIADQLGITLIHEHHGLSDEGSIQIEGETALSVVSHQPGTIDLHLKLWSALERAKWDQFEKHQTVVMVTEIPIVKSFLNQICAESRLADQRHLILAYYKYGDVPEIIANKVPAMEHVTI